VSKSSDEEEESVQLENVAEQSSDEKPKSPPPQKVKREQVKEELVVKIEETKPEHTVLPQVSAKKREKRSRSRNRTATRSPVRSHALQQRSLRGKYTTALLHAEIIMQTIEKDIETTTEEKHETHVIL